MKPSRLSLVLVLLSLAGIMLPGCDTSLNMKAPGSSYFLKYFGNEGSQAGVDFIYNPVDNTFVLFGTSEIGTGDPHFYLVKADAQGNILWEKSFGNGKCQARDIELASNGNIVLLGNIMPPGQSDYDIYMSTLQDSTTLFERTKGFRDTVNHVPANDDATTITETSDGFIIGGSSGNMVHPDTVTFLRDAFFYRVYSNLLPYDPNIWQNPPAFGQGTENVATKIVEVAGDPDFSFYVFGYTKFNIGSQNDFDFWYFPLTSGGSPGQPNWLGTQPGDQKLFSVIANLNPSSNMGFLLGGIETGPSGDGIYVVKLGSPPLSFNNTDYAQLPPRNLQIDLGKLDGIIDPVMSSNEFVSMCLLSDNTFLVLTNDASTGNSNLLLTKRSGNGNPKWSAPVVFGGQGDDFAGAVQVLPDGRIVILGTMTVGQASVNYRETKMVLIKVNQDGQFAE